MTGTMYHGQVRASRVRGHVPPNYELWEFRAWCFSQPNFNSLYLNWIESGCDRMLKPSADRLDSNKPYTFDNLRLVTFRENVSANSKIVGLRPMTKEAKKKLIKFRKGKAFPTKKFEWSRKYPYCQQCGTTEIEHDAKGLCHNCYERYKYSIHKAQKGEL